MAERRDEHREPTSGGRTESALYRFLFVNAPLGCSARALLFLGSAFMLFYAYAHVNLLRQGDNPPSLAEAWLRMVDDPGGAILIAGSVAVIAAETALAVRRLFRRLRRKQR